MPISESDLTALARSKIEDANILLSGGRPDGAAYLCGYAVEVALKACICRSLGWTGYPATRKEFEGYQSFKTHTLVVLLHLSGRETFVRTTLPAEWSLVVDWDPEVRYEPVGKVTADKAKAMIEAADELLRRL